LRTLLRQPHKTYAPSSEPHINQRLFIFGFYYDSAVITLDFEAAFKPRSQVHLTHVLGHLVQLQKSAFRDSQLLPLLGSGRSLVSRRPVLLLSRSYGQFALRLVA
jgi:hypothetical protein